MKYFFLYIFFLILSFPLFYFVFKFGNPDNIAHDFYHYYPLYDDFDFIKSPPPFNMRCIGAFFIYLIHQTISYPDTETVFQYNPFGFKESVWFSAVFFNYLILAATALLIFLCYRSSFHQNNQKSTVYGLMAALLFYFGYGILFFDLMPITEAFSVFLFSLALYLLKHRSKFIWLTLPFIIFQREFLLVLLMIYVILEVKRFKIRFTGLFVIISILLLAFYVLLRNYYFLNPYLDRKSTRLNSSHIPLSRMPSSA